MTRSFAFLFVLSATLLLGTAPGARAQQAPARKPTPRQPVTSTAKRSAGGAPASTSTRAAAGTRKNDPDAPNTVNANGSIGSQESADGKGQGAYAAPGAPINPANSQKTESYDGKAAKPASSNSKGSSTLKPAKQ